jgi:hypothetical protein
LSEIGERQFNGSNGRNLSGKKYGTEGSEMNEQKAKKEIAQTEENENPLRVRTFAIVEEQRQTFLKVKQTYNGKLIMT